MDCYSPLTKNQGFIAWAITGDQSALNGFFEVATYFDATTTDTTRELALSRLDPGVMLEVQGILRSAKWCSHNPNHLAMILGIVKRGANALANGYLNNRQRIENAARFIADRTA
jgi:hypothetical protein